MKVIFVTDSYFPQPSPNAVCVKELKDEFDRRGIETQVVALRTFSAKLNFKKDDSVRFINPDYLYSRLFEANHSGDIEKIGLIKKLFRLRGAVNGFFWPLCSTTHIYRYKKVLSGIIREREDECIVIGVYKSLEGAVSAALVKKLFGNVMYILYTLDAVSGSIIPKIFKSSKVSSFSVKKWEQFLFSNYDFIYLMKSHKVYYVNEQYDKVRNKFRYVDIPLYRSPNSVLRQLEPKKKKHLVFTGSLAMTTAYPLYLLDLLDHVNDDDIRIDFYGNVSDESIFERIKASKYSTYQGVVKHEDIAKIQDSAYALLNFGNSTPCAIPCKIFEYFSTGRPVISFYKIDEDASKPYVEKYPNSLLLDERDSLEVNALKFKAFLNQRFKIDVEKFNAAFWENTPQATVNSILTDYNLWHQKKA